MEENLSFPLPTKISLYIKVKVNLYIEGKPFTVQPIKRP